MQDTPKFILGGTWQMNVNTKEGIVKVHNRVLEKKYDNPCIDIKYKYADIIDKELSVTEYLALIGMEQTEVSLDGLIEILSHTGELWDYPMEEKDYCLQENNPVVTVRDSVGSRYFELPEELVEKVRNSTYQGYKAESVI